jgi:hypothetical protein
MCCKDPRILRQNSNTTKAIMNSIYGQIFYCVPTGYRFRTGHASLYMLLYDIETNTKKVAYKKVQNTFFQLFQSLHAMI